MTYVIYMAVILFSLPEKTIAIKTIGKLFLFNAEIVFIVLVYEHVESIVNFMHFV